MSRKPTQPICNKDCEHCPYPDCINDTLDYDDYVASAKMESEILHPKTLKQRKTAAQNKAYREANREKVAAQKKIRTYRQSMGLSQSAFAAPLGVTASCICQWERGLLPANWPLLQSVYPDLHPETESAPVRGPNLRQRQVSNYTT